MLLNTKLLFSNKVFVKEIWKLDTSTEKLHVQGNLVTSFRCSREFVNAEWEGNTECLRLDLKRVLYAIYLNSLTEDPTPSLHRESLQLYYKNIPT